ncbi:IS630 family transposase [Streptomyces adustus]|uniref:IS630 family transposase n=1 Tax=Streptomyces adustus TaxID=1609272 RepID=A0A5N8VSK0_9ACTN|nr:IS630 family transposase [Streptomyces adustus]
MGEGDLAVRGSTAAALDAYLVFEDEAGFSMTPPTARTWSRRGHTPIIRVRGRSQRRISIAALTCYKPGERSRLIYRPLVHPDHKTGGRRSFAWTDYRDLLTVAYRQLGKPIVLVWDNLNVHRDRRLRGFIDAQDWITVHYLPPYAPQLNPVEGVWSLLRRRCQANTAFTDPAHLMRALKRGLREVQYRPALIDGCLAGTGLATAGPDCCL